MKHSMKTDKLRNCPLSAALDDIGDRWSLLILREIFEGRTTFVRMVESLGIARNILADRLHHLVDCKVVCALSSPQDKRQIRYRLTPKGADLLGVLAALRLWGQNWGTDRKFDSTLVESKSRSELVSVGFKTADLQWIEPQQVALAARDLD